MHLSKEQINRAYLRELRTVDAYRVEEILLNIDDIEQIIMNIKIEKSRVRKASSKISKMSSQVARYFSAYVENTVENLICNDYVVKRVSMLPRGKYFAELDDKFVELPERYYEVLMFAEKRFLNLLNQVIELAVTKSYKLRYEI